MNEYVIDLNVLMEPLEIDIISYAGSWERLEGLKIKAEPSYHYPYLIWQPFAFTGVFNPDNPVGSSGKIKH